MSKSRYVRLIFVVLIAAATAAISSGSSARSSIIFSSAFCAIGPSVAFGSAAFPPSLSSDPAELILLDGTIYTGDSAHPRVEAVAISSERFVAVGPAAEVRAYLGAKTQVMDLRGGFAMPGFNDAHTHLGGAGQAKLTVDLEGAASIEEVQKRIRARLGDYKPDEWITGRGWDQTLWPEKRFPTRRDLDAVSREHPMFFVHISGHVAVANSRALEIGGVSRDTKDPPGGSIERDASREPTGMLKEGAAIRLLSDTIPSIAPQQRRHGIVLVLDDAAQHGVTSLQDNSSWDDFLVYGQLKNEGRLTARITEWLPFAESLAHLEEMRKAGGTTDLWLRTGALKMVTDGALGSRTAALLAAYSDEPANSGIPIIDAEWLKQMVIERDQAGFQIALHAIGDRANRDALGAFAAARAANGSRDSRHRIEHAQVLAPEDIPRFAQLGVIASMQPSHETTDMRWAEARLGPDRSRGAYAWNSLRKHNARLAFGTDYPVEVINPMRGLYACVTRARPEGGPAWQPQERISIDDCIAAYTSGSAYAEFAERDKGRIARGQLADFIVLSADPTKVAPAEILNIQVLKTFVGGRQVWPKK